MFRVTKVDGYFCVITYGEPEDRIGIFLEALPKYAYELKCEKVSLSLVSNFINSLRSYTKNGSLNEALQDKNIMCNSLIDCNII